MARMKGIPVELTPEESRAVLDHFNAIHAKAREAAAKDPAHPYNCYLKAKAGVFDPLDGKGLAADAPSPDET